MAEEQFYTILTNVGKAKIANATLLNSNLTLKTLKVGDGNGTYYNPTEDQEDLKNTVHECAIGAIYIDKKNPNWIISETIIPGSVGGFTIREVGLFDAEGDMIAVGKYPETYKPVVANGASKDLNVTTIFEVSNAENVTLNLDPSVIIATKEDVNNLQEQIDENTAQLKDLANRNLLINGGFLVWQRGTSFNTGSYTVDRWAISTSVNSYNLTKTDEGVQITLNEVGDGVKDLAFLETLEQTDVIPLRGKKVTFSVALKLKNVTSGNLRISLYTGTTPNQFASADGRIALHKDIKFSELSSSEFRTFQITSNVIGDNVNSLTVIVRTGSDGGFINEGGSFIVKQAKLELGNKATPFIPRLYGEELALCQRYYEVTDPDTEFLGSRTDGERFTFTYRYPVCKRIGATISFSHGGASGVLHIFSEAIASQLVATVTKTNEKEVKWTMPVNTGNIVLGQGASAFGQIVADAEIY